jgi:hypothetical protein
MLFEIYSIDKEMEELLNRMSGRKLPGSKTYFVAVPSNNIMYFLTKLLEIEDSTPSYFYGHYNIDYYYDDNYKCFITKEE